MNEFSSAARKLPTASLLAAVCACAAVAATAAHADDGRSAAPAATAAASLNASVRGASPRASLKVRSCAGSSTYAKRKLTFRGAMRSIGAGGQMQMRFTLLRRYTKSRSKRFRVVRPTVGSSLGTWLSASDATVTTYIHNVAVTPVETRALYRARTQFRWRNASGKVVARAKRTSGVCKQRVGLPNLRITSVQRYPNPGQSYSHLPAAYAVTIKNTGKSSAGFRGGTVVAASKGVNLVDGTVETTPLDPFDAVKAGESIIRVLYGPECNNGNISIEVDPSNLVRETSNRDNTYTGRC